MTGLEALNSVSLDETLQIPDDEYARLLEQYRERSEGNAILNGIKRLFRKDSDEG